jgi:hypothetical protein
MVNRTRIAFHCTKNLNGILQSGLIVPSRMANVFLFKLKSTAQYYIDEFKYKNIMKVEYDTKDIENTWKPKWARNEPVIKLKPSKCARLIEVIE